MTDTAIARLSESDTPAIELRDVTVVHRVRGGKLFHPSKVRAMDKVNLSVHRGETLGIVGESGCGKTTTARVMVGLQKPTSGEVFFRGKPRGMHARDRKDFGRAVSVVFQDPATALNPRLPIRQVLMDPLNVHGIGRKSEREARVRDLLGMVGLPSSVIVNASRSLGRWPLPPTLSWPMNRLLLWTFRCGLRSSTSSMTSRTNLGWGWCSFPMT